VFVHGVIESLENAERYEATYQVLDRDGRLLYRSPGAPERPLVGPRGVHESQIGDEPVRLARVVSSDGRVQVILAESAAIRRASILPTLEIIGGGQILILLVCLIAVWWAARRGLAPLRTLAAEIGRRRPGDLRPIDGSFVFTEVAPLIAETNALLAREAERLELERGFLADAAHELRTPLAAIAAQAHLLTEAGDMESRQRVRHALEQSLERTAHLLAQLLTIARLDASDPTLGRESCDVAELVRRRVAAYADWARVRAIALEVSGPDSLVFEIHRSGVESLVDNLVDNAIRYTPPGGVVNVSIACDPKGLALTVLDNGPGIPQAFLERVFERFYRLPGTEAHGSGLGLAIVRRVVEAHQATVTLTRGLGEGGLGVFVQIPALAGSGR